MFRGKLIIWLLMVVANIKVFGQNTKIRYVYKVTYVKSGADSSTQIIEMQYLNRKGQEVKALGFGPAKGDTCYTYSKYNKAGEIINEITICNDRLNVDTAANATRKFDTTGVVHRNFTYNKNGRLVSETQIRRLPYFEVLKKSYSYSCNKTLQYGDEDAYVNNAYSFMNIECYDDAGNITRNVQVNYKGDTVVNQLYLYRCIRDTAKYEIALPDNVIYVGYLNKDRQEVVRDYYNSGTRAARLIWAYANKKRVAEELYSYNKMAVLSQTVWVYNHNREMIKMAKKELDTDIENVLYYSGGHVIRKEYFASGKLMHAIVYTFDERKF